MKALESTCTVTKCGLDFEDGFDFVVCAAVLSLLLYSALLDDDDANDEFLSAIPDFGVVRVVGLKLVRKAR